jgi:hypothetical protein
MNSSQHGTGEAGGRGAGRAGQLTGVCIFWGAGGSALIQVLQLGISKYE